MKLLVLMLIQVPFAGIKKYTAFGNPDKLYCDTEYCYVNERKIKKFVLLKVELCFLRLLSIIGLKLGSKLN